MHSGLMGTIYTQSNSGFMENPYFEKMADFSCVMWICGGLARCGQSALLATKKASFGIKTCRLAIPLITERKVTDFYKKYYFTFFYLSWVKKVGFGSKKRCFGVFWTECEVADLKQRQKIFKMNHRNKIQLLVSPTDDRGDAPECITEYGPCTCEHGHICHKSANFSK